ncbi:hypothetical protein RDI58_017458 [Solanum bulbocastanum]|uniref:F-box domain-containing protein n=1 Tax=Solanum bulbocastanum TaxID=147425 RepID=A0AAN8T9W7_SOLBU
MDFPTLVIKVTGNTELLTEILLRLPSKSLLRLQTVCKDWLFHISSQRFRLLHSQTKQMSSLKVDGFFFCCSGDGNDQLYFVYNPTTNQRRLIPLPCTITNPNHHEVMVMNLAVDPMESDRYKIVCIMKSDDDYNQYYVYSSETRVWRNSTESSIWILCVFEMPSTVIPIGVLKRYIRYFGESGGHLHLIEVHGFSSMSFEVVEMDIVYSKWFVKYRVD